jgi:hypothetical protein
MLRSLVGYVANTSCWLADSHGVPNLMSDPPGQPFTSNTKLSHMVLLDTCNEPEGFSVCDVNGTKVNFYSVMPLTDSEASWKRTVGIERSLYYIIGSKAIGGENIMVDYVINPSRPCAVDDLGAVERYGNEEDMWETEDEEEPQGEDTKN